MKKVLNYKTMDSLKQAAKVINEASESIQNPMKITVSDDLKEIVGAGVGMVQELGQE